MRGQTGGREAALAALAVAVVMAGAWRQSAPAAQPAAPAQAAAAPAKQGPGDYANFDTADGRFTIELFKKDAPLTVQNFEDLAAGKKRYSDPITHTLMANRFYDGLLFFRTVPGVLIQTGDVLNSGVGSIGYNLKVEKNALKFDRPGRVGMAQIEGQPNSRSSQIFIMLVPNPALDADFLVMGQVTEGLDVVAALSKGNKPRINRVTIQAVP